METAKSTKGVRGREVALIIITWQTRKVFNLLYFTQTIKPEKAIDEDKHTKKLTMNINDMQSNEQRMKKNHRENLTSF